LISLRRQSFSLSRARFRPPGNIHNRSRLRRTNRTLLPFTATSFDDFAIYPIIAVRENRKSANYLTPSYLKMKLRSPD
jgi:hypothetical protein